MIEAPSENTWLAAAITASGLVLVKALGVLYDRHRRRKKDGRELATENAAVDLAEIEDRRQFRSELVNQIKLLWGRIEEQDDRIATLQEELSRCESRHLTLSLEHERLLSAVRRRLPDFRLEDG